MKYKSNQIEFVGYRLYTTYPKWIKDKKTVINTINPHSFCVSQKDSIFKKALMKSDILLPDGIGIVFAMKYLKKANIERITGSDIHIHYLKIAQEKKLRVFYLGSSEKVLNLIESKVSEKYKDITIQSYSPPFKNEFSPSDNEAMINKINEFLPDIVFVGMTAPKQEKWVYLNQKIINTKVIISIGAVFDFYAGTCRRAPKWVMKLGLEWLFRFVLEPKRMWTRYVINNPKFIFFIIKHRFNLR